MPNVTDSPDGVHPHLKVDTVLDHPDGEIRLWVKQKFHVMDVEEAEALVAALTREIEQARARRAPKVVVPEVAAAPEPELEPASAFSVRLPEPPEHDALA